MISRSSLWPDARSSFHNATIAGCVWEAFFCCCWARLTRAKIGRRGGRDQEAVVEGSRWLRSSVVYLQQGLVSFGFPNTQGRGSRNETSATMYGGDESESLMKAWQQASAESKHAGESDLVRQRLTSQLILCKWDVSSFTEWPRAEMTS
ncbi:putative transmembrane protein [Toxoplasma gondii RUB]|uniref:Putative transmembrane protein n=1 Tax=Toxoplasma gondii RUB TaxID=935652 RepID=A0A086LJ67_TOXGO|nr:putative transmembrane protein [Toxoplasma gondii RUB]